LIAFDLDPNGEATGLLNHVGKMVPNFLQTFACTPKRLEKVFLTQFLRELADVEF